MQIKTIKIKKLVSVEPDEIYSVYYGKEEGCRCGCNGVYFYSALYRDYAGKERGRVIADQEINDRKVKQLCKILNENAGAVEITDGYILNYTQPGTGKVYTAYLIKRS